MPRVRPMFQVHIQKPIMLPCSHLPMLISRMIDRSISTPGGEKKCLPHFVSVYSNGKNSTVHLDDSKMKKEHNLSLLKSSERYKG